MPPRSHPPTPDAQALLAQGQARIRERQWDAAVAAFRRALEVDPGLSLAQACLGYCYEQLGHPDEAVNAYREAQALSPQSAELAFNLGNALRVSGRLAEAAAAYESTLRLDPAHARAHNNLGTVRQLEGDIDGAMGAYRKALEVKADYADALANLASAHMARNELAEALARYAQAVAADPQSDRIRFNEGVARLLAGDLPAGWDGYERRVRQNRDPGFGALWDGRSSLSGRRLLVSCEQGIGDTIQCVRYLPLLRSLGAELLVQVQPPLVALLEAQPEAPRVVPVGTPLPPHDCHVPLMSLPWVFQTRLETIPSLIPYLHAQRPSRVAGDRPRVGIAWAGNPGHRHDRSRSIPFAELAAVGDGLDVTLVSLQKELTAAEAQRLGLGSADRPAVLGDFAQTADLVAGLDLIISVDTAVAHLAGAMGKPVWILLPFSPDWRWLLSTRRSPWYPTATLWRQARPGEWGPVMTQIKDSLARWPGAGSGRVPPA